MRNIGLSLLAVFLVSGCASQLLPVVDKAYVPDIQLSVLAEKMRNAVDPNGLYRKSVSYYLKQEIKTDSNLLTIEVTFKSPDKSKTVFSIDGETIQTTVCNGSKCWKIDKDGDMVGVTGGDLERLKLFDALSAPSGTILDVFAKVEFAGEENVYGTPCYILLCHPKSPDLAPIALYASKTDYLNRKIVTAKDGEPYVAEIRKYSLLKGVMIASETEMDINGDGRKELMTVTDYTLDVNVPDASFEVKL